jgi:hypothetical protein
MTRPDPLREQVVDQVVGGVLHHLDLLEDDRLLLLDVVGGEPRVTEDVGEQIDREGQVLVEHAHVEAGVLLGRERVHVPPHRVDRAGDVLGRAGGGALEDQMLDQVGDAAQRLGLRPRARLHPDADRHRAHVRHRLGDEANAVGQRALAMGH